ncbi:MAG: hypothetical protein J0L99_18455 [Chitinophagales bacterium]|nr:hypothetical protein [Chitinophagales bacterium]
MRTLFSTLLLLSLLAACQNQPSTPAPAPSVNGEAIMKHKYWLSKNFNDAVAARTIVDTLGLMVCSELIFLEKDTLLITACNSDASFGVYKFTGPNTIEVLFDGFTKPVSGAYDAASGVLHIDRPEGVGEFWSTDFVAQDGVNPRTADGGVMSVGRQRLAGEYALVPQPGQAAATAMLTLRPDGTAAGLGIHDRFDPWMSGIGSNSIIEPPMNGMFLKKSQDEDYYLSVGWQFRNDTLRLWDLKNLNGPDDLPEYKAVKLMGTYVKQR